MKHFNDDLLAAVLTQLPDPLPQRLGVAVSGGGDSVALLHLAVRALSESGCTVMAATVDHGLRPGAGAEAEAVAGLCADLGVAHETLHWRGWDGQGNLQDRARRARYGLLTEWAAGHDISLLLTGHTADDQAETVLMRLGRSSGVSGLSGMAARREMGGVTLLRPLLRIARADLRCYLRRQEVAWAEDPSNDDVAFDRIRVRQALEVLEPLGLTTDVLIDVAQNMAQAREALGRYAHFVSQVAIEFDRGDVLIDGFTFGTLPEEIRRRLLIAATDWIAGSEYPPRRAAVEEAMNGIAQGSDTCLGGCRILQQGEHLRVCRELAATQDSVPGSEIWDGRWRFHGPETSDSEVRPLGETGLQSCPGWRDTGRPHAALTASPSLWVGDELVAAPLAGFDDGHQLELIRSPDDLYDAILSH